MIALGTLTAQADKLSPDARVLLDNRGAQMTQLSPLGIPKRETVSVFVAVDDPSSISFSDIEGVRINGIFDRVVTVTAPLDLLEEIASHDDVRYIQLSSKANLLNDFTRSDCHVDEVHNNQSGALPGPYTGKGVIVGIIDTGVEYAHPAYFTSDGSELRIRQVWDQNSFSGPNPEGYTYGKEYVGADNILGAVTVSQSQYHGGHTMGTAAGADKSSSFYGMAPDADIVFVSFAEENTNIADAIKYIFDYADKVSKPCVINMSLGSHYGPHDGTSYLDQIIDELSGPGHIIVGACGNEGEAKMHAMKTFTATDKTLKTFLTLNPSQSHNQHVIEIWGSEDSDLKVNFLIANSVKGQIIRRSDVFDTSAENKEAVIFTSYLDSDGITFSGIIRGEINPENGRPHIWIQSTLSDPGTFRLIGLEVTGDEGASVHMWNLRQHFFSSNNLRNWTDGTYSYTVGEIGGTARRIISVGSYDGRSTLPWIDGTHSDMSEISSYHQFDHSSFSSYGPTADGRIVPHILAPGMPVISALNRYAYPSDYLESNTSGKTTKNGRNFYYVYNMGTSMATPDVAGIVALMLQADPELTPEEARDIIQQTAVTDPSMGTLPNNTYGAGRINALECVKRTVELTAAADGIVSDTENAVSVWADTEARTISVAMPDADPSATLTIYSMAGATIHTSPLEAGITTVDAHGWGHGVYVAKVAMGSFVKSFKLIL